MFSYGSINNFDTVNDTGVPCHGFEIELDDIHQTDITYTCDLTIMALRPLPRTIVIRCIRKYSFATVVGKFLGAQMSAYDVDAPLGLIDHLADGEVGVPYDTRTIIIAGTTSFVATTSGSMPDGLTFDPVKGELSATPNTSGKFIFNVQVKSSNGPPVSKAYPFMIAESGEILAPHNCVDVSASPGEAGIVGGTGVYENGSIVTGVDFGIQEGSTSKDATLWPVAECDDGSTNDRLRCQKLELDSRPTAKPKEDRRR